jgi:hypothetical protein
MSHHRILVTKDEVKHENEEQQVSGWNDDVYEAA